MYVAVNVTRSAESGYGMIKVGAPDERTTDGHHVGPIYPGNWLHRIARSKSHAALKARSS